MSELEKLRKENKKLNTLLKHAVAQAIKKPLESRENRSAQAECKIDNQKNTAQGVGQSVVPSVITACNINFGARRPRHSTFTSEFVPLKHAEG